MGQRRGECCSRENPWSSECFRDGDDRGGRESGEGAGPEYQRDRPKAASAERHGGMAIEEAEAARNPEPEASQQEGGKVLRIEGKGENDAAGCPEGGAERQRGATPEGIAQERGR